MFIGQVSDSYATESIISSSVSRPLVQFILLPPRGRTVVTKSVDDMVSVERQPRLCCASEFIISRYIQRGRAGFPLS